MDYGANAGSADAHERSSDCYLHNDRSSSSTGAGRVEQAGTCIRPCTFASCGRGGDLGSEAQVGNLVRSVKEGKMHDELTKSWTAFRSMVRP